MDESPDALAAAGSLPRTLDVARPSEHRRIRLIGEILVVFVVLPLVVTFLVYGLRWPLFVVLPPVLAAVIAMLVLDPSFRVRRELRSGLPARELIAIVGLFAVIALLVAGFMASEMPQRFLAFPRARPRTWAAVMVLYPLLSVAAQELVYRTFFFHRYGPLFGARRGLAILANGALFALAHVMFYNPVALGGTFLGGCLFAWRYERTRSLWAVVIEHTLYGWLIFTVGLGGYFFTGIANPALR